MRDQIRAHHSPADFTLDERELTARAESLSLEQKVRLLTGEDFWSLCPEPAAGLRRLVVSDGPAGVRGERWDERDTSANIPSPTALAATWDEELVEELGVRGATQRRRRPPGADRQPTPHAIRRAAFRVLQRGSAADCPDRVAFVRGVQRCRVGGTVKHFIANDSETERMTLDARVDERTLRKLYAPWHSPVKSMSRSSSSEQPRKWRARDSIEPRSRCPAGKTSSCGASLPRTPTRSWS